MSFETWVIIGVSVGTFLLGLLIKYFCFFKKTIEKIDSVDREIYKKNASIHIRHPKEGMSPISFGDPENWKRIIEKFDKKTRGNLNKLLKQEFERNKKGGFHASEIQGLDHKRNQLSKKIWFSRKKDFFYFLND